MVFGSLILLFFYGQIPCQGASIEKEEAWEQIEDLGLDEVEEAVDQLLDEKVSIREMTAEILESGQILNGALWKKVAKESIWSALGVQKENCVHILVLVLLSSVLYYLSDVFRESSVGEIAFYMVYVLLFVLLLKSFDQLAEQLEGLLEGITVFMKALLPSYYIALTAAGGAATAAAFYQMILLLILLTEQVLLQWILPAVRMYLVLELINFLTKEEFLSKMTELLKNVIVWAMKSMIGLIVGMQLIQRLIAPALDMFRQSMIGKTAEVLPGVGNLFSGITEVVVGAAVLIKNCLGAAAIIILLLAAVGPLLRIVCSSVVYQFLAAVVQPITDKRMVGCIHTMGESLGMLGRILLTVEILFLLTIAIVAGSLN